MAVASEPDVEFEQIPPFNERGLLPTQLSGRRKFRRNISPYACEPLALVRRYGFSEPRHALLSSFFEWRAAIYGHGFVRGFHIIGGSFVDDCEARYGRPPADIDALTVIGPVVGGSPVEFSQLDDLHSKSAKERFRIDARLVSPVYGDPLFASSMIAAVTQLLSRTRDGLQRGTLCMAFSVKADALARAALR